MTTVGAWLEAHRGLDRRDREVLLCRAAGLSRAQLLARPERPLPADAGDLLAGWAARRQAGEPVAYILGSREFWGLELEVTPAVLVPRPETELLVETATALWERSPDRDSGGPEHPRSGASSVRHSRASLGRDRSCTRVLELGTGSGAIVIALGVEAARRGLPVDLTATDVAADALTVASRNAARHAVEVTWCRSDWFETVAGRYQMIVSNPPYVAEQDPHLAHLGFEPRGALVAGADGLDAIRSIADGAPAHLTPGAALILEHGYDQGPAVRAVLAAAGFCDVATRTDLSGHERVTSCQWRRRSR